MAGKKVIIIGAGVAGLSAGCYLQMNGFDTRIFELWKLPGGVCTAWQRKGYTFDGCIHWLVGSSPANGFHKIWKELHAIQGREWIEFDEYTRIELRNGKTLAIYSDIDKLEAEMNRMAPEDTKVISELADTVRTLSKVDMSIDKPMELFNLLDYIRKGLPMLPFIRAMGKFGKISVDDYLSRFTNPDLKEALGKVFGMGQDFPAAGLFMILTVCNIRSAGYPIGGSLEFARAIEKRYLELGGIINYNSRVVEILVENDKATGILLENGEVYKADIVISAADGHDTLFKMLKGKYIDADTRQHYDSHPLFPPTLQVSLGIAKDFKGMPHSLHFPLSKPINTGGMEINDMTVRIYNFDATLAPAGKTSVIALPPTSYEYWEKLKSEDPKLYDAEKDRVAYEFIDALEKQFGDIKDRVEAMDVATPMTYIKYTNNHKGSWEGWFPTTKGFGKSLKKALPGLENFYMIGQWVDIGGGLPPAGLAGKNITQIICKKYGKAFTVIP